MAVALQLAVAVFSTEADAEDARERLAGEGLTASVLHRQPGWLRRRFGATPQFQLAVAPGDAERAQQVLAR